MSLSWPAAAAYTCLTVALNVAEPSQVEITTQDRVRVDHVTASGVDRHGELLNPGTNTIRLEAGTYVFRTAHDASINLAGGQVSVTTERDKDDPSGLVMGGKDIPPDPDALVTKGDSAADRVPVLTVIG